MNKFSADQIVRVKPPGDKSLTHRTLILGALATGTSTVTDALVADDTQSTVDVLRHLGVSIDPAQMGNRLDIRGDGLGGFSSPTVPLDCGNSGTAARLLMGVLAGSAVSCEIVGDDSLSARPMGRVTKPLRQMGARIEELNGDCLPIRIHGGSLHGTEYESPVSSAQVKSALLLAGLMARVPVTVREPSRSRDHTERLLGALGVPVTVEGEVVRLEPVDQLPSFSMRVPGDPSSAAFPIAAALLGSERTIIVEGISLNPTRTAFFDVIGRMGAVVETEHTGTEWVSRSDLSRRKGLA